MQLKKITLALLALTASSAVFAHGYISSPASRAYSCQLHTNKECGSVQYEPQSVEAPSGFPTTGPKDGKIASGGRDLPWAPLDAQSYSRWQKQPMKAGAQTFTWTKTAPHKTRNWRYYITRQNWDTNQPLSRAAFDLQPFCQVEGNNQTPPTTVSHTCQVPSRTGYQVIYGVWEIADTLNSFYQVIDVMFDDASQPGVWSKAIGTINPTQTLKVGDSVKARFFDNQNERPELMTEIVINSDQQGQPNQWSYLLASEINKKHSDIRSGQKDNSGTVNPVFGSNTVYVKNNSQIVREETQITINDVPVSEAFTVYNVKNEYIINNNSAKVDFTVSVTGKLDIEATVSDLNNIAKGYSSATVDNTNYRFDIPVNNVTEGYHNLVIKSKTSAGVPLQENHRIMLKKSSSGGGNPGQYDAVFPNNLANYTAGTKVLQPKNGKVYECKPFPYSGYCKQWTANSTAYEPAVGHAWSSAWIEK